MTVNTDRRAVVVSEQLGAPLDEGIRKFATCLVEGLSTHLETHGIAAGPGSAAPGGKLFGGKALRDRIRAIDPGLIVYVPSASGTLFSFLRARSLKRIQPSARVALVLTQGRRHTAPVRKLLHRLAPDAVLCQSAATGRYLESIGITSTFLPSGVDLGRFQPVSAAERRRLRTRLGLPVDDYLVLHAGHLKHGRNTGLLGQLEGVGRGVMLAGRSAGRDPRVKRHLEAQGVIVIDTYVERVEELYQAVDCYLFPVRETDAAMEFPLSVLEAMACDLPVVAHPYGGLPLALEPRDGLVFAESDDELIQAVARSKHVHSNTRQQATSFGWDKTAATLLEPSETRDARAVLATV